MNKTGNGIRPKSMDQDKPREPETSRLVDAVRRVRIASADKSDVVVEMRDAVRTRLELLAQDLKPVIEDIPPDDDRFDFALSAGLEPRFWIDATAHVMMGPDRRTYRFVRDTRLGRILLAESANRDEVAERVISYIAMRIHERELAFSGDTISYRELVDRAGHRPRCRRHGVAPPGTAAPQDRAGGRRVAWWRIRSRSRSAGEGAAALFPLPRWSAPRPIKAADLRARSLPGCSGSCSARRSAPERCSMSSATCLLSDREHGGP